MSLLKGWLRPDYTKPEERFIDLDGVPYDGKPDGAHPIRCALGTPVFKATLIAGLFMGAGAALGADQGVKQDILMVLGVCFPCASVVLPMADAKDRRREYPSLRNVVIDKTGRAFSDAQALFAADDYYRRDVEVAPRFLPIIPFVLSGLWTGFNHLSGYPALQNAGLAAAVAIMLTVPFAARAGWAAYARRQLETKRWTVTANPPALKTEAREPARADLTSALLPARIPVLAGPKAR